MKNTKYYVELIHTIEESMEAAKKSPDVALELSRASKEIYDFVGQINLTTFLFFCKYCVRIVDKQGNLVPFIAKRAQRKVLKKIFFDFVYKKKPVRILIPKYRQVGMSTLILVLEAWLLLHQTNFHGYTITNKEQTTNELRQRLELLLLNIPDWYHAKEPDVSNQAQIIYHENNSKYDLGTAGSPTSGRGITPRFLHASEIAFWAFEKQTLQGLFQGIPYTDNSWIIIESTGNGPKGEFYRMCNSAEDGKSDYGLSFLPAYLQEEYTRNDVPDDIQWLHDEEKLLAQGLTPGYLWWRRRKIEDELGNDGFTQEYPHTMKEVFLSTSKSRFSTPVQARVINTLKDPDFRGNVGKYGLTESKIGMLKIWEEPRHDARYAFGFDGAFGVGADNTALVGFDHDGKQVLQLHGQIPPEDAIPLLVKLGNMYNNAYIAIELNSGQCGGDVIDGLMKVGYTNLYRSRSYNNIMRVKLGDAIGYMSSTRNKSYIITSMIEMIIKEEIEIRSTDIYNEMPTFLVRANGKMGSNGDQHDDLVDATAIALEGLRTLPDRSGFESKIDLSDYSDEDYYPYDNGRRKSRMIV